MPIVYDKLLKLLDERGITSYTIKKDNIIGQATLKKIKEGGDIDTRSIAKLCKLLNCQPGDIIEYIEDENFDDKVIEECFLLHCLAHLVKLKMLMMSQYN